MCIKFDSNWIFKSAKSELKTGGSIQNNHLNFSVDTVNLAKGYFAVQKLVLNIVIIAFVYNM